MPDYDFKPPVCRLHAWSFAVRAAAVRLRYHGVSGGPGIAVYESQGGEHFFVRSQNAPGEIARVPESGVKVREVSLKQSIGSASVVTAAMKLEVVIIPVSDVDRAKEFYGRLRWRLDADFPFENGFRVVQFTPPGSACSIQFGVNITLSTPGSIRDLYLVVSDIAAAREELIASGVEVSEVFHAARPGAQFQTGGRAGRVNGFAPAHASYGSYATFSDPDGNSWLLQEVTIRLPGRVEASGATFTSAGDLANALRRAEAAHDEQKTRSGQRDTNWHEWYAAYIVAEAAMSSTPPQSPVLNKVGQPQRS